MNPIPPIIIPDVQTEVVRILTDKVGMVTDAIPDAVPVQYFPNGYTYVDVPFNMANMETLTRLGQPAVSPVFNEYHFPGRFRPFLHQYRIIDLLTRAPRAYCFSGMGTGKTMAALWAADYLLTKGYIRKVLIVCPKTLMYSAWAKDLTATIIHRSHTVLYGDAKRRRHLAMTRDTDIDIINFDGVEILEDVLLGKGYDLVIVDESTAYKDPGTKRWKSLVKLVQPHVRCWLMTGTPTPQGSMDAYGQAKLCTPERLPRTKSAFQSMVQYKVATFIWRDRSNWQEIVNEVLQPAIRIRKSDCLDLPPVTRTFLDIGLSSPQQKAVEVLKRDSLAEFEADKTVTAANAAVLHGKLRQIYSGAVYSDDGTAMVLDNKSRIAETVSLIREAKQSGDASLADGKPHSKALVFAPFKHTLAVLEQELGKHFNVAVISGDTSVHDRTNILHKFQTEHEIEVIIAIPEAFSHGVTATAASLTIWYAPPTRTETYLQACERMDRPGQTQQMNIVHLYGDQTEFKMYQNLMDNRDNQDLLLALFHDFIGFMGDATWAAD